MDQNPPAIPFSEEVFEKIEAAAIATAKIILTGRYILDVEGPYGLGLTTVEVGNDDLCQQSNPEEASVVVSHAVSVPMIYRRFTLSKRRIAAAETMGQPLNLKAVQDAAQVVALQEEAFIYHGQPSVRLPGLLTTEGRNVLRGGDWGAIDRVLEDVIAAVNLLDTKGYRGPYGLALAPPLYNNLFRHYAGTHLLQVEHLKRLCTRGIVKAPIEGGVLVAADVGPIVLGHDLQVSYLGPEAAHWIFTITESFVLKIEAPDAICTITPTTALT